MLSNTYKLPSFPSLQSSESSLVIICSISKISSRIHTMATTQIPPNTAIPRAGTTSGQLITLEKDGPIQMGFWVPNRLYATAKYLFPLRRQLEESRGGRVLCPLHSTIAEFKQWVDTNGIYRMLVNRMLDEANSFIASVDADTLAKIRKDGDTTVFSYDVFFGYLDMIINTSPSFNTTVQVGTPMNGLLAVPMGTPAGAALFHDATFNAEFKKVLDAWNAFLKSPKSLDKLDIQDPEKQGSWISQAAFTAGVWNQVAYDPSKPGYGFDSWNSFFIRPFVNGARPFQGDPTVSVNIGCETTPWQYVSPVVNETSFWVKDVDYSLYDILGSRSDLTAQFSGGQVYQGFLSATHYHRWRSPIDGELVSSWVQPGTYFAQRPDQGEGVGTWEGTESQPYLTQVATRAIFIFRHPLCGLIAMVCIGMVEVSTCVIEPEWLVLPGSKPRPIQRDTEIGHFEFGGSTHMMIFQKDKVKLEDWAVNACEHRQDPQPIPMGTVIATAVGA